MSWQQYVDEQLIGPGLVQGAIIGLDGNPWAQSAGFGLKAGEGAKLSALFKEPAKAFSDGILVNAIKYLSIKADPRSIYGKKGAGGVITVKTTQCIIIGVYNETLQPGNATNIVEKLADYLIDNGY